MNFLFSDPDPTKKVRFRLHFLMLDFLFEFYDEPVFFKWAIPLVSKYSSRYESKHLKNQNRLRNNGIPLHFTVQYVI